MFQLLAHPPGDVDARHVVDGKHAHRHAEARERAIDLFGRRALFDHELGFVHVGKHHAIADEPRTVPCQHTDLPQPFGERKRRGDRARRALPAAHDLQQPHDVRRAEEVQADDIGGPGGGGGNRVDVERGRVRAEDRPWTRHLVQLGENPPLQIEALEHRFDDDVSLVEASVVQLSGHPREPFLGLRRAETAALDRGLVVAADVIEASRRGPPASRPGCGPSGLRWRRPSRCRRPSCRRPRSRRARCGRVTASRPTPGTFADGALGEKEMNERLGLLGAHALGEDLAL